MTKRTLQTKRRGTRANGAEERPIPFQPVGVEIRRAATRAGIAAEPDPWELSGPAFDGEDLREDCTPADLFAVAYSTDPHARSFLRGAIEAAIDDFELIAYALDDEENRSTLIRRVAMRSNYRLRVAVEVGRRMIAAEGGAS